MDDRRIRIPPLLAVCLVPAASSVLGASAVAQVQKFPQSHSPTQSQPLTVEEDPARRSVPGSRTIVDDLTPMLFLRRALEYGRAEVLMSQLALQRAERPATRDFALRMIADHGRANQELEAIARERGIALPSGLGATHQATLDTLQVMSGEAFEQAYLGAMQQDHQRSIAMFETALQPGFDDPGLVAFARRTLPVLRAHAVLLSQAEARTE